MAHLSDLLITPTRGASRFRLAIKLGSVSPKPYMWEIYEDERDDKAIRQSALRFRTSKDAWAAGTIALDVIRTRSSSTASSMSGARDGLP